jgi:acetyl-CoA/propionyl-CoA carboxylase biotin carboxyl carrier protein
MFSKVLIANRGEIAVRIIRTCRELGISSVAVYSEPDRHALHRRLADEAVHLDGATARETYLNIDALVRVAKDTGAEAVHPGYGFLAENADFANAVTDAGMVFIGPPADAIAVMGEKVAARAVAAAADVPQVPGSEGAVNGVEEILAFGEKHGYPLAIKASYGGGGRGMRTVADAENVSGALESAQREAGAAFGRSEVFVERYLQTARHVEVQVFADTHGNVVWLGDRDCSVQRRHQKLVEEAPAPGLSSQLRTAMGEASVRLARAVDYVGAGTVEFLVEADRDKFYFLEMNTRIQVEHPVTEMTLGLDLIAEQLRVAAGGPLSIATSGPPPRGHAIEIRVNAEDVSGGAFRPSPGLVEILSLPARAGVRFDSGYEAGDEVLPFYDSLIGKLIIWAPTREHAIDRTLDTIREFVIGPVLTTLPAAAAILDHRDFRTVLFNTLWLENELDLSSLVGTPSAAARAGTSADAHAAGTDGDASVLEDAASRDEVWVGGRHYRIQPLLVHQAITAEADGPPRVIKRGGPATRQLTAPGAGGRRRPGHPGGGNGQVTSPMQGTVVKINVAVGDEVEAGALVAVVEAMKMENPVKATVSGRVGSVDVKAGQVVPAGTVIVQIDPTA